MRLREMLDESLVKVGLKSVDKDECIEEMVDVLVRAGRVTDRAVAVAAVRKREAEGSTGVGGAFAVPHGKCEGVSGLTIALGTSRDGVEFDSVDDKPARVVFMVLASKNEPGRHLQALAEIVRLIRIPGFCDKLAAADNAKSLLDILDATE